MILPARSQKDETGNVYVKMIHFLFFYLYVKLCTHVSVPWCTEATDRKKKVFWCKMCVYVILLWQLKCQGTVETSF